MRPFPRTARRSLSDTGLSTHAGAADACTESLNSLSLPLSLPLSLLLSFSPSLPLSSHPLCLMVSVLLIRSLRRL